MTVYLPHLWPYNANLDANQIQLTVDGQPRNFDVNTAQQPWSLTNPAADDNTIRFEVRHGDVWHQGAGNDQSTGNLAERSELSDPGRFNLGQTIYVSYDWLVETTLGQPADQMLPDWYFCDIGQIHGLNPSTSGLFMSWGGDKCRMRVGAEWADENPTKFGAQGADTGPVPRGRRYHFDWIINMASTGGRLKVTRTALDGPDAGNPHVLVDYTGAMPNQGSTQFYWKHGIYRGPTLGSNPPRGTLAIQYSNFYIGTSPQPVVLPPPPTYEGVWRIFYKVAAADEPATQVFTHATAATEGILYSLTGADHANPVSPAPTFRRGSGQSAVANSITPARDNTLIIDWSVGWTSAAGAGVPPGATPPFDPRFVGPTSAFADGVLPVAAPTGNKAAALPSNSNDAAIGVLVAVQPAQTTSEQGAPGKPAGLLLGITKGT